MGNSSGTAGTSGRAPPPAANATGAALGLAKSPGEAVQPHTAVAEPRPKFQWNWPSSVEPFRAAVEVFGSTVVAMVSK